MRILFVVEHFYPYTGGAEELFLNLTTALAREGHEVNVVTTLYNDSLSKKEDYQNVHITRVRCFNRFLFTFMSLPAVLRLARNADLIHTTSYNSAVPAFIAGMVRRKKVVITFHEVWGKLWFRLPFMPKWKLFIFYLYEQFILRLPFHRYIAVSNSTRSALIQHGISESRIVKIYNGVDDASLKTYMHKPPSDFTFCFFGRLGISKGLELLPGATRLFVSRHPNATLKLIIPTYPEPLLRKVLTLVKQSGAENNIRIMHDLSREDLLREVSTSSCVIIPSHSEGFCFVAVEAVSIGVPVISSGKGSLPEVVSGKFLLLDSLSEKSIVESLEKAIKNEWENKPFVSFSLEASMKNYFTFYSSLMPVK